jgi:hypothetical protein
MDFTAMLGAVPVILTLVTVQGIKIADQKDKFKKFYFLFAVAIGLVLGAVFSSGIADTDRNWTKIVQDAILNAIIAPFAVTFKKQLGIKLPGDTGFVAGQFFGYKE